MRSRVALLPAAALLLVALSVAFAWRGAPASAASRTRYMTAEAWYNEPPPCVSLIDCSPASVSNPYPADTVHVSSTAGQETARTYLAFSIASTPGETLLGGTLTLPIDAAAADGSLSPDQATLEACLVTKGFHKVRGSTEKPPEANCKISSQATYDPKTSSFTVDLTPLAFNWRGTTGALALVPAQENAQPGATWHVVFHDSTKPSKDAPPITASLEYESAPTQPASHPAGGTGTGGGSVVSSGGGGSFSGSFPSQPSTIMTTTTTTTTTSQPQTLTAPASLEGFAGPGFAYPAVWALPLLFLAGIGAIGRALTKELYRRGT